MVWKNPKVGGWFDFVICIVCLGFGVQLGMFRGADVGLGFKVEV